MIPLLLTAGAVAVLLIVGGAIVLSEAYTAEVKGGEEAGEERQPRDDMKEPK